MELCFKLSLLQSCNTSQLTLSVIECVRYVSVYTQKIRRKIHTCIYTCTRGYLAPSQIPYPTQRAIVVSYDNELNMPSSGMCENGAVSVQKCPLSHSLKEPVAPLKHDWHTNAFVSQCGANAWRVVRRVDARGHPGCRPKSTPAICRGGGGASPKCLEVNYGPVGP